MTPTLPAGLKKPSIGTRSFAISSGICEDIAIFFDRG
jgi:hypothetical protein